MRLSTSHSDTTSTGAIWMRRMRSILPYQPQPMRPTRLRASASSAAYAGRRDHTSAAAPVRRNRRRFSTWGPILHRLGEDVRERLLIDAQRLVHERALRQDRLGVFVGRLLVAI